jgi:integrase
MAITEYTKDDKKFFKVYVQARGKSLKRVRLQKVVTGIKTLAAARREEKRLIRDLATKVAKLEGKGLLWSEVIHRWEVAGAHGHLGNRLNRFSIREHSTRLRRYTKPWLRKIASELTKGDGRQILEWAKSQGASINVLKKLKTSINQVFNWGIEESVIKSGDRIVNHSPVYGLGLEDKVERTPPILTLEEIRKLLFEAKLQDHLWYPHWAFAVLSGMRSGELYVLEWSDVDEENGIIRVSKSFNRRAKEVKSTKSGKWRNVSISPQLKEILTFLRNTNSNSTYILPRVSEWNGGRAGQVLRSFLKSIGIDKHVVFHTLRACFATHLLATGAEPMKVMRMGGWSDLKTFQIYIRMAGVDVKGVSDALDVLPKTNFDNTLCINK